MLFFLPRIFKFINKKSRGIILLTDSQQKYEMAGVVAAAKHCEVEQSSHRNCLLCFSLRKVKSIDFKYFKNK